jgi:hypothetical protein
VQAAAFQPTVGSRFPAGCLCMDGCLCVCVCAVEQCVPVAELKKSVWVCQVRLCGWHCPCWPVDTWQDKGSPLPVVLCISWATDMLQATARGLACLLGCWLAGWLAVAAAAQHPYALCAAVGSK